jgi:hypothetical protein
MDSRRPPPIAIATVEASTVDASPAPCNPTPCMAVGDRDPAELQELHCAHRRSCLDVAARGLWESFTCAGCQAYRPMPASQWRDETIGLAAFGRALAELIRAGDPSIGMLRRGRNRWRASGAPPCARSAEPSERPPHAPEAEPGASDKP